MANLTFGNEVRIRSKLSVSGGSCVAPSNLASSCAPGCVFRCVLQFLIRLCCRVLCLQVNCSFTIACKGVPITIGAINRHTKAVSQSGFSGRLPHGAHVLAPTQLALLLANFALLLRDLEFESDFAEPSPSPCIAGGAARERRLHPEQLVPRQRQQQGGHHQG
jgi:hypothetical protein